jgi:hypothetical protein
MKRRCSECGCAASLTFTLCPARKPGPILANGGAIAPLLLAACFAVASFVGRIVLMFSRRPGLPWLGLG